MAAVTDGIGWRAYGEAAHIELAAGAVAELGGLVADLIHRREDVVGELDFCDRGAPYGSHPDAEADKALFVDRHVEHSLGAKFVEQSHRAPEDPSECYILTKEHRPLIGPESDPERVLSPRAQYALSLANEERWVCEPRGGGVSVSGVRVASQLDVR